SHYKHPRSHTLVAATNPHPMLANPDPIIKRLPPRPVGQCKYILINCFPRFIAQAVRLGVIRVEYLTLGHHGAGSQPLETPYSRASSRSRVVFSTVILTLFMIRSFPYRFLGKQAHNVPLREAAPLSGQALPARNF